MDQISAAIERARQGRKSGQGDTRSGAARAGTLHARPAPGPRHIRYTTTTVVEVDYDRLNAHNIFAFDQSDPRSLRFDMLRTQVLQTMEKEGLRTLGVTSPSAGCGKTTVAMNLALAIAREFNHTALLIDFDLRKPSIANIFGLGRRTGLSDVLVNGADIGEALVNPGFERIVVLPNFRRIDGSSELLTSDRTKELVNDVRGRYAERIVIFDLPPLLQTDDGIAFLPSLDCSLLVASAGLTSVEELEACDTLLGEIRNLGLVLNRCTDRDASAYRYAYY